MDIAKLLKQKSTWAGLAAIVRKRPGRDLPPPGHTEGPGQNLADISLLPTRAR